VRAILTLFFRYLYTTLAWSYDAVAWLSSMGQWRTWQTAALCIYPGPVLELGHGPGHVLLDLENAGNQVIGLDPSPQMSAMANRRRKQAGASFALVRARAQQLPFAADFFCAVIATFPTEFILAEETLNECFRVLITGGELIVIGLHEITGKGVFDRFASLLYRFTGQSGEQDPNWRTPIENSDFTVSLESVDQPRARIHRLRGVKHRAD
jgi:ubiquinone/menaquinone biosynthesis C-methylase UbiE